MILYCFGLFFLQAGMRHGDFIKFDQVADEAVGHIPGDLIFVVHQLQHPVFTRSGDDLFVQFTISLLESLVGFSKTLEHLDGHQVVVAKEHVTYCSEVLAIPNEGMPIKGGRGRGTLYITLNINFPHQFSENQKKLIRQAMA